MKISIVTPSYNQIDYLPAAMESVLLQGGDIEYVVVDGGSKDGSAEHIAKHASRLAWSCSEPDEGQYQAINKGFARTTGEIMAWLNSSDSYLPWTFEVVREVFTLFPDVDWITSSVRTCNDVAPGYSRKCFWAGQHGSRNNGYFIQQESCFWRRRLWDKIGSTIPSNYSYAADFHLWSLFFEHAPLTGVNVGLPLAYFRQHGDQRSTENRYMDEIDAILAAGPPGNELPAWHQQMHVINESYGTEKINGLGKRTLSRIIHPNDEAVGAAFSLPQINEQLSETNARLTKVSEEQRDYIQCLKENGANQEKELALRLNLIESLQEKCVTQDKALEDLHARFHTEARKKKKWWKRLFS